MKRKRLLALALLPLALLLSGCEASTQMQIYENDTYSFSTHLTQPRTAQNIKCKDQIPGIENYLKTAQVAIKDKSTEKVSDCTITVKAQHISQAKKPFVTIKHIGDSYLVKLEPVQSLDFLDAQTDQFRLTITFPGPVLRTDAISGAQVKDNTVTWTTPQALVKGFEVRGQDHPGITMNQKWGIAFLVILVVAITTLVALRKHPRIVPIWNQIMQALGIFTASCRKLFLRALSYLDLGGSSSGRRTKHSRRRGRK
ncbi:LppM family (lipo)protein [Varibaculum vaginae]|uniref:LppM family (lipo)protein n=1 Tax=Varibaculum vaginae TaxID=2364797 RepID=UPI000F079FB6|nr:hypothetical protein [Varibaculum vaginae]